MTACHQTHTCTRTHNVSGHRPKPPRAAKCRGRWWVVRPLQVIVRGVEALARGNQASKSVSRFIALARLWGMLTRPGVSSVVSELLYQRRVCGFSVRSNADSASRWHGRGDLEGSLWIHRSVEITRDRLPWSWAVDPAVHLQCSAGVEALRQRPSCACCRYAVQ